MHTNTEFFSIECIAKKHKFCYDLLNDGTNIKLSKMIDKISTFKNLVGYLPTKEILYIATELPSIDHEIAHMLEMKDFNRLVKPDLGLKAPWEIFMPRDKVKASVFFAASAREARVIAIQSVIRAIESISSFDHRLDATTRNIAISNRALDGRKLYHNNAWLMTFDDVRKHQSYGKFKTEYEFIQWLDNIHEKTVNKWNKDRIIVEFKNRLDFINNWMETKWV